MGLEDITEKVTKVSFYGLKMFYNSVELKDSDMLLLNYHLHIVELNILYERAERGFGRQILAC